MSSLGLLERGSSARVSDKLLKKVKRKKREKEKGYVLCLFYAAYLTMILFLQINR